jgi:hypothetical protein
LRNTGIRSTKPSAALVSAFEELEELDDVVED